MFLIHAYVV